VFLRNIILYLRNNNSLKQNNIYKKILRKNKIIFRRDKKKHFVTKAVQDCKPILLTVISFAHRILFRFYKFLFRCTNIISFLRNIILIFFKKCNFVIITYILCFYEMLLMT
jgi:hypothetical protein